MRIVLCAAVLAGLLASIPGAWAQAKPDAALSDAERAKRDGDKVFRFIKLQAQRPAAVAPAVAVAAAVTAPPARPAVGAAPRTAAPAPANAPEVGALLAAAPTAAGALPMAQAAAAPVVPLVSAAAAAATAAAPAPVSPLPEPAPAETEEIELALITHVQPELPNNRMGTLRSGSVWVQFTVEPDGRTNGVVARPGGQMRLAQSAVRAVQQWRFAPITEARDVAVEIAFKLE